MPAFNFKRRFVPKIRADDKTHTIRARRPPGLTLGAWAPLYSGQRTSSCILIGSGRINRAYEVRLDFDAQTVTTSAMLTDDWSENVDEFAIRDGFESWANMEQFWAGNHPGVRQFSGVLMGWDAFTREHRLGVR